MNENKKANKKTAILVVGLGSIGGRHLKNLRTLYPDAFLVVYRHCKPSLDSEISDQYADELIYSLDSVHSFKFLAAIICNPANLHIKVALQLAEANINLFIEKPLSNNLDGVQQLINICSRKKLIIMVGYHFHFSATLNRVKELVHNGYIGEIISMQVNTGQYLPDWRPGRDYRKSVSARNALGGGCLLELSHELDYACWLFGKPSSVFAKTNKSGFLDIDVEDTADILLEFASMAKQKIIANIHVDMIQRISSRQCKIVGTNGTIVWDANQGRLGVYVVSNDNIKKEEFFDKVDKNDMYIKELKHFFNCIEQHAKPMIPGENGLDVLKIILAAKESNNIGKLIKL